MLDGFKRNPIFYSILLLLLAVGLSGLWYLSALNSEMKALKVNYETKAAQYARYVAAKPSPTKSNLEALDRNYHELYEVFQDTMAMLNLNTYDRESFFGDVPQSRADWSFEVHKFIEDARNHALSNGIGLPPNPQFGISKYTRASPQAEDMESVHAQIVIMTSLLQTLFDSGIQSFVKLQRGVPAKSKAASGVASRGNERLFGDGDEFVMPANGTAAVPGIVDAYSFRFAFRGQSIALRTFVNRVANAPLPFVIRSIEVDLASESGSKSELESFAENPFAADSSGRGSGRRFAGVPIISDNTSLFVVTIEFLELVVDVAPPETQTTGKATDA